VRRWARPWARRRALVRTSLRLVRGVREASVEAPPRRSAQGWGRGPHEWARQWARGLRSTEADPSGCSNRPVFLRDSRSGQPDSNRRHSAWESAPTETQKNARQPVTPLPPRETVSRRRTKEGSVAGRRVQTGIGQGPVAVLPSPSVAWRCIRGSGTLTRGPTRDDVSSMDAARAA
jgi:hypothetical protein